MQSIKNVNIALNRLKSYNNVLQCLRSSSTSLEYDYLTPTDTKASRTSLTSPRDHTADHIGMWYNIDSQIAARLFKFEGLTNKHKELLEVFQETSIMIRKPAVTMIDYIKRSNLSHPPNKFLLYGRNGAGKTMTLAHMIHHLVEENFIVIHSGVPARWSTLYREILPSTTREGFYDHTLDASLWLQQFLSQNEMLLNNLQLVTQEDHIWNQRETTPKGSSLSSIADFGITRSRYASECIFQLFNELKVHANEGRIKLAVVIDGINSLFLPLTQFKDSDKNLIPIEKSTLVQAFISLLQNDWKNGVILGSVDVIMSTKDRRESFLPRYLLKKKGWETLDPFVPIPVDKYTDKEFESAVNYYLDRKWLQHPAAATREGKDELHFLSGAFPLELVHLTFSR